jgi:cell wall-associated NlpC family hydrolase
MEGDRTMTTLQGPPSGSTRRRALQSVPTPEPGRRNLLRRSIVAGVAAALAAVPLVVSGHGAPSAAGASVVTASAAGAAVGESMAPLTEDAAIGADDSAMAAGGHGADRNAVVTNSVVPQAVGAVVTAVGATAHGTPAGAAAAAPARPAGLGVAATAAVPVHFDAGEIISDAVFYDTGAMTDAQIESFLQAQGAGCNGPSCLRNIRVDTETQAADRYCAAYPGAAAESAAAVIGKVSRACGVNPQVMLTTLQKESGLLDRTDPAANSYDAAWGWHCPDTGPGGTANCDPAHAGFFRQAYGMAEQWARYRLDPGRYHYRAGQTAEILWNVTESGCGGAPVTIANTATASLYNYTPYQPNAASLASYPGTGDACSSYGNRNFFFLFHRYFGGGPALGGIDSLSFGGQPTTVAVPRNRFVDPAIAGRALTVPTAVLANGLRAGFDMLGTPYVWGGGGSGAGPDNGCRRGGSRYNSCGHEVGFDCSGLTAYVLGHAGRMVPGDSAGQRAAGVPVSWNDALPGDIIGFPGHVAVYLGTVDGERYILEASWVGVPVHIVRLSRRDADPVLHRYWSGGPASVFGALIARSTTTPTAREYSGAFRLDRPERGAPWTLSPFSPKTSEPRSAAASPRHTSVPVPSTAAPSTVPSTEQSATTPATAPASTPSRSTSPTRQGPSATPLPPVLSTTPTTRPATPGPSSTSSPSTMTTPTPGRTTASTSAPSTPKESAPATPTSTGYGPTAATAEPIPTSSAPSTPTQDTPLATTAPVEPTEAPPTSPPATAAPTTAAPPPTTSSLPPPTTSSMPPPSTTDAAPPSDRPADGTSCPAGTDAEAAVDGGAAPTPTVVPATAPVVTTVFAQAITQSVAVSASTAAS